VIVDLMMEEVDSGTRFVKELRLLGNTAPIFMLSSVGENLNLSADPTALGLAGVFQKPIDRATLLGVLKARLGR
jgi:DNA-binding response OmpR family regulator